MKETKWTDIQKAPWPDKFFMCIDVVTNPFGNDWPIATNDATGEKHFLIRIGSKVVWPPSSKSLKA